MNSKILLIFVSIIFLAVLATVGVLAFMQYRNSQDNTNSSQEVYQPRSLDFTNKDTNSTVDTLINDLDKNVNTLDTNNDFQDLNTTELQFNSTF